MLDRSHRFHGLNSLSPAYKHGQITRGGQMALRYAENPRRQTYRVAVVVSKKVDKSAVARNRIRRRIFEVVRTEAAKIQKPFDLILTVYDGQLATIEHDALRKQVADLFRRAGIDGAKPAGHGIVNQKKIRGK